MQKIKKMNIIPAKNNVHFGIMFIFKNSEQNTVTSVFIVLPGILLFCSLILSYHNSFFHNQKIFFREMNKKMNIILLSKLIYFNVFLLSYFWIFLSVIRNFEWFFGLILLYLYTYGFAVQHFIKCTDTIYINYTYK